MKRDTAQTIFRTVVFAGAMLGTSACGGKKPAPASPSNTAPAATETGTQDPTLEPKPADGGDPCAAGADPCAGGERPRGTDPDGGGGTGRGFILS
ncbi:MAG TPA: hypothetical protein VIU61_23535 [Kofleriaceae bacterium]